LSQNVFHKATRNAALVEVGIVCNTGSLHITALKS